jgi:hypothetical protein
MTQGRAGQRSEYLGLHGLTGRNLSRSRSLASDVRLKGYRHHRNGTFQISLRRHRNPDRHIWMIATEITDVARMLQHDATGPLRRNGDVPVFVARRRRMRDEVTTHPFDRVADMGRDLRWRKVELVNGDADRLRRKGGRGGGHQGQHRQRKESRTHRLFLVQRLGDMLGVLLMTLEYLETGGQKVLQLRITGVGDQDGL